LPGVQHIILFAGTYTLSIPGANDTLAATGDLNLNDTVDIIGHLASDTIIDGGGLDRIFQVNTNATISDVTIQHGAGSFGGGLWVMVNKSLVLQRSAVIDNTTGAVIDDNHSGGGIGNNGTTTLTDCVISGNNAGGHGGGIFSNGFMTISGSEISNNTASTTSGGISSSNTGVNATVALAITNSTVSGNSAPVGGGVVNGVAFSLAPGTLTLRNVTVTNNTGSNGAGGVVGYPGTIDAANSIIAGNHDPTGQYPDCAGNFASQGYNLIQDPTGCTITGVTTGNLTGVTPNLGPLANNGGPTRTHALLTGSPAIDAGNPATPGTGGTACPATDQRGTQRPRGAHCDIGAVEQILPLTVDSTTDAADAHPGDGVCDIGNGTCTLRAAVQEANALPGADTIILPAGTYMLSIPGQNETNAATGDLNLNDPVSILGHAAGDTIIDGGGLDRVLQVNTAATISDVTVQHGTAFFAGGVWTTNTGVLTLQRSVIRNNATDVGTSDPNHSGGGIGNNGTTTLIDSVVTGNSAGAYGGGIFSNMVMAITGSEISSNSAGLAAGGAVSLGVGFGSPSMAITNSTISGNSAPQGGGLLNVVYLSSPPATVTLRSVTVTDNTGTQGDGGIGSTPGTIDAANSVIAGNHDPTGQAPDCSGNFTSQGYNLIQDTTGCTITGVTTGNLTGAAPNLGPLANNGGPTRTHALLANSQAINAGNPAAPGSGGNACPVTDERGTSRPQFGRCDVGAYEATALCGNHIKEGSEECDDGNQINGDGCDVNCTVTACGNHIVDPGEQCDNGLHASGNGCEADCTFTPVSVSNPSVAAGGQVSTGSAPSPQQPVVTAITTPNAGAVSITQAPPPSAPSSGFAVIGQQITISAPPASVNAPLVLVFSIDASEIPSGADPLTLVVLRDGAAIADCSGPAGVASPDPCVSGRVVLGDGDVQITVLTSSTTTGTGAALLRIRTLAGGGPSVWSVALPAVDAVVLAPNPITVTVSTTKSTVTKNVMITVRNADTATQTIRLSVDRGTCPSSVITSGTVADVALGTGKSHPVKLPLTINQADFMPVNKKTPVRCVLALTATALPVGGSIDPTPENNSAVLELNVLDSSAPAQFSQAESFIKSAPRLALNVGKTAPSVKRTVRITAGNGAISQSTSENITVTAADGTCPAGTIGVTNFRPAMTTPQPTASVQGGMTKSGLLQVTIDPMAFTTKNAKSPARCIALLSAAGPSGDTDVSNNTTKLVIDVLDRHDVTP